MRHLTTDEKQLISSLAWFRSRYALFMGKKTTRKASKKNIEAFGKIWIGTFKLNWDQTFQSLVKKGILIENAGEYVFSETGLKIKNKVESTSPFFKYEYDNYFFQAKKSAAHSLFCQKVYGLDLSQHGLIDQNELNFLIQKLSEKKSPEIVDIGCGNGKITQHLASVINSNFTGLDVSNEAISEATSRTSQSANLHFETGNMDYFKTQKTFDAILFLDTLYYSNNMQKLISDCLKILNENGTIYAYFSQWIMDSDYIENLNGENTQLAKILNSLNIRYTFTDLTESTKAHWKKKLLTLESMRQDFVAEGSEELWNYRYREAHRYANWDADKTARYFYEIMP